MHYVSAELEGGPLWKEQKQTSEARINKYTGEKKRMSLALAIKTQNMQSVLPTMSSTAQMRKQSDLSGSWVFQVVMGEDFSEKLCDKRASHIGGCARAKRFSPPLSQFA